MKWSGFHGRRVPSLISISRFFRDDQITFILTVAKLARDLSWTEHLSSSLLSFFNSMDILEGLFHSGEYSGGIHIEAFNGR